MIINRFVRKKLVNRELLIKNCEIHNLKVRLGIKQMENQSLRDQVNILIRIINNQK